MKSATLQLFEYLLAAQNSSMASIQDVGNYPAHWSLDELLTYQNVELLQSEDGFSRIIIHSPDKKHKKIQDSALLATLLNLLQYDETDKNPTFIAGDELRNNLIEELETINRKIGSTTQGKILINEWQKLLLGVAETNISYQAAISAQKNTHGIMEQLVNEYEVWRELADRRKSDAALELKEGHIYDWVAGLDTDDGFPLEVNFGVGMLYINSDVPISHPILTMKLDVIDNRENGEFELRFGNRSLVVDNILNYVLFYGADVISEMKEYVADLELNPFDQEQVGTVLQEIIQIIHPKGQYFPSPAAAMAAVDHLPQILHLSVLFAKEKSLYNHDLKQKVTVAKQKSLVKYLSKKKPTDVLNSVVDPGFVTPKERTTDYRVPNAKNLLFPWASPGVEHQILNLLDFHNAVTVMETGAKNNHHLTVNLLTHLVATGKRVLVMGEVESTLDAIQNDLPVSLAGLHTKLAPNHASYMRIKNDLALLMEKKANHNLTKTAADNIRNEMQLANAELTTLVSKIAEFRELGSRKNYWHGQRYYPETGQTSADVEVPFDIDSDEVARFWQLRPYFTAQNMELLNYQFIDLDEMTSYYAYDRMLALEEKYLQQAYEHPGLDETFDETTDIKFVQYLYAEIPKIMKEVASVTTDYGNNILQKALVTEKNYQELAGALGRINIELKSIDCFDTSAFQREVLIGNLNKLFDISNIEMTDVDIRNIAKLWDFYQQKKEEMTTALGAANSILAFNTKSMELSKNFKGIIADGLDSIDILYNAVALHLSKIDFEQSWQNVRDYFVSYYEPVTTTPDIHQSCIDLYQALKTGTYEDFRTALTNVQQVLVTRHHFITFGEFIEKLGKFAPTFTATMMSEKHNDEKLTAYFEDAMNKANPNGGLIGQISVGESELLENGIDYLLDYLLQLQNDLIEHESWTNTTFAPKDLMLEVSGLLASEHPLDEGLINKVLPIFNVTFMPLAESGMIKSYDPNLFDLVVFADASKSNIMRIVDLMHAHKAVLFGREQDARIEPLNLQYQDFKRLATTYGQTLHQFGEQYFNNSLFNLIANSAAWDSKITLPRYALRLSANALGDDVESGVRNCDTHVEDEIFDALMANGYDVKCKIDVGNTTLDFLISGKDTTLAITVLGDAKLERAAIVAQIEQEIELRKKGLHIRTIQAAHFYLNSRKTLTELYEHLEKLGIYPENQPKLS